MSRAPGSFVVVKEQHYIYALATIIIYQIIIIICNIATVTVLSGFQALHIFAGPPRRIRQPVKIITYYIRKKKKTTTACETHGTALLCII